MEEARNAILHSSVSELSLPVVKGYDFNKGIDYSALIESLATTGLQATNIARSMKLINSMV